MCGGLPRNPKRVRGGYSSPGQHPGAAKLGYSPAMLRLITIPISHYCEKARWALDRARLPYVEQKVLPGLHTFYTWGAARHRMVPVLVHDRGALGESTAILRWVDQRLEPGERLFPEGSDADAIEGWVKRFDKELGRSSRLWAYSLLLADPEILKQQFQSVYSGVSRAVVPLLVPPGIRAIRRRYRVTAPRAEAALEQCEALFDDVAAALADNAGGRYLVGERFSAADLTFASLAAPMLLPAEYAGGLLSQEQMPAAFQAVVARLREHAAGKYAMRLFAEERRGARRRSA